jgi:UDP-N-acetylmuramyl pentapeptide phosphotransferase/UDP-N-acetylglucosamine-1-phosphate transferase
LFDVPDNERKLHTRVVPNLGGLGIFFAYIIVASFFIQPETFNTWHYLASASLLLFLIGIMDDLISLSPKKKFLAQFFPSLLMVTFADVRLGNLHGLFGIYELPYIISVVFSIIGCVFVTNAFNLIDGVDGLAGSVAVLTMFTLGVCLAWMRQPSMACVGFSMMGAAAGFLRYNISPARIFMGDTGSLIIGFTTSILSILFINTYNPDSSFASALNLSEEHPASILVIAFAIVSVPVLDCFRVFFRRITKGRSPFSADRTHIHHYLLDLGLTSRQTVLAIVVINAILIAVSFLTLYIKSTIALGCVAFAFLAIFYMLSALRKARTKRLAIQNKEAGI